MKKFNEKSKVKDILEDARAFEILEEIVPDFFYDLMPEIMGAPPYELIKNFTLKETIKLLPVTVNISKDKAQLIKERICDLEDE
ncbi:MAG: hypothetical protein IJN85_01285 [Oscillospiraceae bacterium]|nr:hypothetical protein [Oscillospiraceae bacterium]